MKIKDLKKLLIWARSNLQETDFIGYSLIKFYNQKYFNLLLDSAITSDSSSLRTALKTLQNYFYLIENSELIKPLKEALKEVL